MEFSKILKSQHPRHKSQAPPAPEEPKEESSFKESGTEQPGIRPLFVRQDTGPSKASLEPAPQAQPFPGEPIVKQSSFESIAPLYKKMADAAKWLFSKDIVYEQVDTREIVSTIAEAASVVASGDEKLVELAITFIVKEEEFYLYQHSVNVAILSLEIGAGLNYEMGKLIELGLAAFLHDIGMSSYEDMVKVPRKLSDAEYDEIKKHVEKGGEILRKIDSGLSETILTAQQEIHERLDGSGYPAGKKVINDYARIIALADAFESMIHPRPFRANFSIMEVYKRIFDAKNKYDQKVIKILVDKIGFFPNGSFVQLNTKEIGRVVRQSPRSPLRPIVSILYGADGEKLDDSKIKEVDLLKFATVHVKKCFLEIEDSKKGGAVNE